MCRDLHRWVGVLGFLLGSLGWWNSASVASGQSGFSSPEPPAASLRVGGGQTFAPYHFLDNHGQPAGFDVDLMRAVARVMGLEVDIQLGPWEEQRQRMKKGELDLLIGMAMDESRADHFLFSSPFLDIQEKIFIRRGDRSLRSLQDLAGREVIVQKDSLHYQVLRDRVPSAIPVVVDSAVSGMNLLASGQHDALLIGEFRGLYVIRELGIDTLVPTGKPVQHFLYGFALRPGNQNLLAQINEGLAIVKQTGEFDEIYRRWFGVLKPTPTWKEILRIAAWIIVPLLGVLILSMVWNWSLKRQVLRQTRALQKSEEKFSKIFRFSPEMAFVAAFPEWRLLDANEGFARITGYSREEVLGRTGMELGLWVDPGDRERIEAVLSEGQPVRNEEILFRNRSGGVITGLCSIERIEVGGVPCVLVVASDITERKLLEQRLVQSQRLEAVGQLAGGIAHDFNNLLTTIQGYGELLLEELPEGDPLRGPVEGILRAGDRAANLTRQILAFSRQQVLQPRVLSLSAALRQWEGRIRGILGDRVSLGLKLSTAKDRILVDPGQLERMLLTLVAGIRDMLPDGGRLVIRTSSVVIGPTPAKVHSEPSPGHYVVLEMEDTGKGIAPDLLPHLFEPFSSAKDKTQQNGLGMATVYGIIKQSGGHIEVENREGFGAMFRVFFPVATGEVMGDEPRARGQLSFRTGKQTILLAEDEKEVCHLLDRALSAFGYQVLAASDPQVALNMARDHTGRIHLLVTDMAMPGLDGTELARRLRQQRPELKVLFISGYTNQTLAAKGLLQPGTSFLQKPFSTRILAEKIREVLEQRTM